MREVAPNLLDISPPLVVTPVGTGETASAEASSPPSGAPRSLPLLKQSVHWPDPLGRQVGR